MLNTIRHLKPTLPVHTFAISCDWFVKLFAHADCRLGKDFTDKGGSFQIKLQGCVGGSRNDVWLINRVNK